MVGRDDEQKVRQRELGAKEGVKDQKEIVTEKRSKVLKDKKQRKGPHSPKASGGG
jgi:hypothetical protein